MLSDSERLWSTWFNVDADVAETARRSIWFCLCAGKSAPLGKHLHARDYTVQRNFHPDHCEEAPAAINSMKKKIWHVLSVLGRRQCFLKLGSGRVSVRIVKKPTVDVDDKGHLRGASENDPQCEIKSDIPTLSQRTRAAHPASMNERSNRRWIPYRWPFKLIPG